MDAMSDRAATTPSERPEPLDLVVVGGGPAGTAAAFRGRELGLSVLVLEYDDLLKRIRDYSKDKLILPSFGGGDRMRFPRGGEMISALAFGPIDKDDMCADWKGLYERFQVPVQVGVELVGLEHLKNGHYRVLAWDHHGRRDLELEARHVCLALGRGVPRRFDLPGNTEGICYRLAEVGQFVGRPSCVVGGGTSAAEAVIAISNAKAAAGDATAVYWSYRGDRLPRVSKALAEVFFEAYVGNGNILYFPRSEPAAIVVGEDREEYLAVRVDRRQMAGRPNETTYLEFSKESCVACIGEDIPEGLLAELGIRMRVGGPAGKKRMLVNRFLETELENVYLAGDLLSQAYFEVEDFAAAPESYREVKHRGNIKSALRDGVLIAQVVRQRLDGVEEVSVEIEEVEEPAAAGVAAAPIPSADAPATAGPPLASEPPERRVVAAAQAFLVRLLPGGVEESEIPIPDDGLLAIGRSNADLVYPDDTLLSERHASIAKTNDGYVLRDDGSSSGTFLRVPYSRKLRIGPDDLLRAGRQFLLIGSSNETFRVVHYDASGREVGQYELPPGTVVLGRRAPDITLDPDDGTLSRRQLALTVEEDRLFVKDLKSVNGTYLRVQGAARLSHGDQIRVGQQLFVFSLGQEAVLDTGTFEAPSAVLPAATAAPEEVTSAPSGATVSFDGGEPLPVQAGQTICDVAEAHGIRITAECHAGICGSDPIRVLDGAEHLEGELTDEERDTLEEICELEAGPCRLACKVRVKGPVKVEVVR